VTICGPALITTAIGRTVQNPCISSVARLSRIPLSPISSRYCCLCPNVAINAIGVATTSFTLRGLGGAGALSRRDLERCVDNGDVRRLRKLDRTRQIDAAMALALAVQGATIEQPRSVYDTRGLIVV
jgi:hypothetical protein